MASPSRKPKRGKAFSGNHHRSWLWGHHAVCEMLQGGRWPILALYATQEAFQLSSALLKHWERNGVAVEIVSSQRIEELSQSTEHQGLLARLGPYPYCDTLQFEAELKQQIEEIASNQRHGEQASLAHHRPLVVICDRIQDSHNFGAILRSCDGTNVSGVIVSDSHQAGMTPHVVRSSSGAAIHVKVVETEDLVATALRIKELGFQLVAADSNAANLLWHTNLGRMTAVVLGSEAQGVAPELLAICDHTVKIPMAGRVSSLNVGVAAGIVLYEIRRQQESKGSGLFSGNET